MKISDETITKYRAMHYRSGEKLELNEKFCARFDYKDPQALAVILKRNTGTLRPERVAWIEEAVDLYFGIYEKTKGQMLNEALKEAAVFG